MNDEIIQSFRKLQQACLLKNPIRMKIMILLYISEVLRWGEKPKKEMYDDDQV